MRNFEKNDPVFSSLLKNFKRFKVILNKVNFNEREKINMIQTKTKKRYRV